MKTVSSCSHPPAIEPLEARIAPASLTFVDVDGDQVRITTDSGSDAQLEAAAHFFEITAGHFQLQELKLAGINDFAGTDLSIEATSQGGDGFVNIGYLNAAGLDLGDVKVDGDLGRIDAGNSSANRAVALLEVKSLGASGAGTQAAGGSLVSNLRGDLGALKVHGDILDAQIQIIGDLSRADIEGSIRGGAADFSGSISSTGAVKNLTVAGVLHGGAGLSSGRISGSKLFDATIGAGIVGGGGENSGQLAARHELENISINGDIIGGAGVESGGLATAGAASQVTINGNIVGGSGMQSGEVGSSGNISHLTLNGSLLGGIGVQSGSIGTEKGITDVHIMGDIVGAAGASSGQIVSKAIIHGLKVDGSLIGGANFETGAIGSLKGVDDITIGKDIVAGTGERSGLIVCDVLPLASIGSVKVLGSIKGTPVTGIAGAGSGGILSGHIIGFVEVGGDVLGGNGTDAGAVRALDGIDKLVIDGSLVGGSGPGTGVVSGQKLRNVEIARDIVGGTGSQSGQVSAGATPAELNASRAARHPHTAAIADGQIGTVSVGGTVSGFAGTDLSAALNGGISSSGNIGAIVIAGDLIGGNEFETGAIVAGGKIKSVMIKGNLLGGAGESSGVIRAEEEVGTVGIEKDLRGGAGASSGGISSNGKIVSVTLHALTGGSELLSGSIITMADIGDVNVTGDVTGADGDDSGKIYSAGKIKRVTIGGNLIGGSGAYDVAFDDEESDAISPFGQIVSAGVMRTVQINGDVRGGEGVGSARIEGASIRSVTVDGSVTGGDGDDSGAVIAAKTDLPSVQIGGNLVAGFGHLSGHIGAARNIDSLEVGALRGSDNDGFRNPALITAGGTLSPGNNTQALAIRKLVIGEATAFAQILAGYDLDGDSLNPDAGIGSVTVGAGGGPGTWTATDLVAGVETGPDLRFGTADDSPIAEADAPGIISRIERVEISGDITSPAGQLLTPHGIVAQQVLSLRVGGAIIALAAGPKNDFIHVGGGGDTTVVEAGVQAAG